MEQVHTRARTRIQAHLYKHILTHRPESDDWYLCSGVLT